MPFEAYCSQTDLQDALGGATKLALLSSTDGVLNAAVVTRARLMGAEVIDAKARSVISPFTWHDTPPDLAKSVNIDLAIANLYKLTYRSMPAGVKEVYDAALLLIESIGTNAAWNDGQAPISQTNASIKWFTPNTEITSSTSLATRQSHSAELDWL